MAKYTKRVDVWGLNAEQRKALQPGQHVSAGGANGRWAGQTRHGIDVAAWEHSAAKGKARQYFKALRAYATA